MKIIVIVFMFWFITSCTESTNSNNLRAQNNLDWILGNWQRTNNQTDKQTFENWTKKSNSEYVGLGYTLHNQDTVFEENLRLVQNESNWYLEVIGVNENPTLFVFLSKTDSSFICENKENEFPKKIEYSYQKNILTAIISDNSKSISFVFKKHK